MSLGDIAMKRTSSSSKPFHMCLLIRHSQHNLMIMITFSAVCRNF